MIVGPTVRGQDRPELRRGDRVCVRVPVAGHMLLEGTVWAARPGHVEVRLEDGRLLDFYLHELRLIRRGPTRVDVCRCPEGHPAHRGAA